MIAKPSWSTGAWYTANSMTAIERQFLIKALVVDEHLRPRTSSDLPLLSWRTIGVLCNLTGAQSDELVNQLAAAKLIQVVDTEQRLLVLTEGREIARADLESRQRRFWNHVHWIACPAVILIYWLIRSS